MMRDELDNIALTREQARRVDRIAIEDYGIPGIVLMENAGRGAAQIIRKRFKSATAASRAKPCVAIVCGRGNNGGDGFVIARHLANARIPVDLFLACDPTRLSGDAAVNCEIAAKLDITLRLFNTPQHINISAPRLAKAAVIVDAVLGTGFAGTVRPPLDLVIQAINQRAATSAKRKIIAIDVPSGLDCNTGRPSNATVRADKTVTFVAAKVGFRQPGASDYTGKVHVVDIGAPPGIVQSVLTAT